MFGKTLGVGNLGISDTVAAYDAEAEALTERYETLDATMHWGRFADLILRGTDRLALDVGAGSGRDAAWLAGLDFDVVAAAPSGGKRRAGMSRHPESSIRWIDHRLPGLEGVHALGLSFDLILLSAVWQHVPPPPDRKRAFRKLATLVPIRCY